MNSLTPPVYHILLALAQEDRHGYAIMQDVLDQTGGALELGPGTLYGCLKRMLAAGLVAESSRTVPDEANEDERRKYYRITAAGRKAVREEVSRIAAALTAARSRSLT